MTIKENADRIEEIIKDRWRQFERIDCCDVTVFAGEITDPAGIAPPYYLMFYAGETAIRYDVTLPVPPVEERKTEMAEFLHRANADLAGKTAGNFLFDCDKGEVSYHLSCPAAILQSPGWRAVMASFRDLPIEIMARYGKGIAAVFHGRATPEAALGLCGDRQ